MEPENTVNLKKLNIPYDLLFTEIGHISLTVQRIQVGKRISGSIHIPIWMSFILIWIATYT